MVQLCAGQTFVISRRWKGEFARDSPLSSAAQHRAVSAEGGSQGVTMVQLRMEQSQQKEVGETALRGIGVCGGGGWTLTLSGLRHNAHSCNFAAGNGLGWGREENATGSTGADLGLDGRMVQCCRWCERDLRPFDRDGDEVRSDKGGMDWCCQVQRRRSGAGAAHVAVRRAWRWTLVLCAASDHSPHPWVPDLLQMTQVVWPSRGPHRQGWQAHRLHLWALHCHAQWRRCPAARPEGRPQLDRPPAALPPAAKPAQLGPSGPLLQAWVERHRNVDHQHGVSHSLGVLCHRA